MQRVSLLSEPLLVRFGFVGYYVKLTSKTGLAPAYLITVDGALLRSLVKSAVNFLKQLGSAINISFLQTFSYFLTAVLTADFAAVFRSWRSFDVLALLLLIQDCQKSTSSSNGELRQ